MTIYKLGKLPKRVDKRTLQLRNYLRAEFLPALPASYDVDTAFSNMVDNNMYGNDVLGDCVIAGRAHMTLRLQDYQQDIVIPISTQDVETEYYKEEGCASCDNGLDMLTSLNCWRQGWQAAGEPYDIYAFAELTPNNHTEIMYAIYLLNGAYVGFNVPQSAMDQFNAGQEWTVSGDSTIIGGHCIYVLEYDADGLTCMTWGKRQKMTWQFWDTYVDEAYGIVDNRDAWEGANDPLNVSALDTELNQITSNPNPPGPTPSGTFTILAYAGSGGTINPSGSVSVTQGTNQNFAIAPNSKYKISGVNVDDKSVGKVSAYTFSNVQMNHSISASFKKKCIF